MVPEVSDSIVRRLIGRPCLGVFGFTHAIMTWPKMNVPNIESTWSRKPRIALVRGLIGLAMWRLSAAPTHAFIVDTHGSISVFKTPLAFGTVPWNKYVTSINLGGSRVGVPQSLCTRSPP